MRSSFSIARRRSRDRRVCATRVLSQRAEAEKIIPVHAQWYIIDPANFRCTYQHPSGPAAVHNVISAGRSSGVSRAERSARVMRAGPESIRGIAD